jgi:hypothetical protein
MCTSASCGVKIQKARLDVRVSLDRHGSDDDARDDGHTIDNRDFAGQAFSRTDGVEVWERPQLAQRDPPLDVAVQHVALRSDPAHEGLRSHGGAPRSHTARAPSRPESTSTAQESAVSTTTKVSASPVSPVCTAV